MEGGGNASVPEQDTMEATPNRTPRASKVKESLLAEEKRGQAPCDLLQTTNPTLQAGDPAQDTFPPRAVLLRVPLSAQRSLGDYEIDWVSMMAPEYFSEAPPSSPTLYADLSARSSVDSAYFSDGLPSRPTRNLRRQLKTISSSSDTKLVPDSADLSTTRPAVTSHPRRPSSSTETRNEQFEAHHSQVNAQSTIVSSRPEIHSPFHVEEVYSADSSKNLVGDSSPGTTAYQDFEDLLIESGAYSQPLLSSFSRASALPVSESAEIKKRPESRVPQCISVNQMILSSSCHSPRSTYHPRSFNTMLPHTNIVETSHGWQHDPLKDLPSTDQGDAIAHKTPSLRSLAGSNDVPNDEDRSLESGASEGPASNHVGTKATVELTVAHVSAQPNATRARAGSKTDLSGQERVSRDSLVTSDREGSGYAPAGLGSKTDPNLIGSPSSGSTASTICLDRIGWVKDQDGETDTVEDDNSDSEWWSEGSSIELETTVLAPTLTPLVPQAAHILFAHFRVSRRNSTHQRNKGTGNNSTSESTDTCGASLAHAGVPTTLPVQGNSTSIPASRKRPSDEEDEDQPRQRRKLSRSVDEITPKMLACPFAKNNPFRHRTCFKYNIQEISRLKQHLLRVHLIPVHCAKCSQTFRNEEDRDSHLREVPGCTLRPPQVWDGITGTQKSQLKKRVSTKKSKEENWYLIYEILFPDSTPPQSPYVDGCHLTEELLALREFATQEAPVRIAAFAQNSFPPELRESQAQIEQFTQAAVENVFDTVISRWLARRATRHPSNAPTEADSGYLSIESAASNASGSPSQQQMAGPNVPIPNADNPSDSQIAATVPLLDEGDCISQQTTFTDQLPEARSTYAFPNQHTMNNAEWLSSIDELDQEWLSSMDTFNPDLSTW